MLSPTLFDVHFSLLTALVFKEKSCDFLIHLAISLIVCDVVLFTDAYGSPIFVFHMCREQSFLLLINRPRLQLPLFIDGYNNDEDEGIVSI